METLSDKIGNITCNEDFSESGWNMGDEIVWAKGVQQAVIELKEMFSGRNSVYTGLMIQCAIDKIFGDRLI